MKIFNQLEHTHMPFIIDEENILFCKAPFKDRIIETDRQMGEESSIKTPYQAYDIYGSKMDGTEEYCIGNGSGVASIACSPNCYTKQDGSIILNYVRANIIVMGLRYHHYTKQGGTLSTLGNHKRNVNKWGIRAYCISENSRYLFVPTCSFNTPILRYHDKEFNLDFKKVFNCDQIKRVMTIANEVEKVIITYVKDNKVKSAIYDIETKVSKDIKVGGNDVYKCSIYNNIIVHSVRGTGQTYSMQIHKDTYTLEDSSL